VILFLTILTLAPGVKSVESALRPVHRHDQEVHREPHRQVVHREDAQLHRRVLLHGVTLSSRLVTAAKPRLIQYSPPLESHFTGKTGLSDFCKCPADFGKVVKILSIKIGRTGLKLSGHLFRVEDFF
jgi:hypothetical protein